MQRKTHKRKPKVEATSAFEAMEKMVQERKLSKKINYDVLKDLNPPAFKPAEFLAVRLDLTFIKLYRSTTTSFKRGLKTVLFNI